MKHKNEQKNYTILRKLSRLPGKIVSLHGLENITEFVLHDLANKDCFNFSKASYFVDNPDFDSFKGVVGYTNSQAFEQPEMIWDNVEHFSNHMKHAPFNKKVRNVLHRSPKRGCLEAQRIVDVVAKDLEMDNPLFFCWDMKHYNHGLFIFEKVNGVTDWDQEDLLNGLHLLSLCPIF